MRDIISRFLRSGVGTLLWAAGVLLALGVHFVLLFANYAGLVQAFEILGTDQRPMGDDAFLGWLFDTILIADSTQSHFLAASLAVVFAVGFFVVFYLVFKVIRLAGLRARSIAQRDTDSAKEAMFRIVYDTLPYLILTGIPLGIIMYWDYSLFRLRSVAGSLGIEAPEEALALLKVTPDFITHGADNLVYMVDMIGGLGYLAAAVLSAIALKFMWSNLAESAVVLEGTFLDLLNIKDEPRDEPEAAELPVLQGNSMEMSTVPNINDESPVVEPAPGTNIEDAKIEEARRPEPETMRTVETSTDASSDMIRDAGAGTDELIEVVGGNEQRISQVMANPEKYFRHADGRWWDRSYYERIHEKDNNDKEVA